MCADYANHTTYDSDLRIYEWSMFWVFYETRLSSRLRLCVPTIMSLGQGPGIHAPTAPWPIA